MRCIRKNCKNEAEIHSTFGVIPCKAHQRENETFSPRRKFQFANIGKLHRIQAQRDHHGQDLEQPYIGNKVNKSFFQLYPDRVEEYNVREELAKI